MANDASSFVNLIAAEFSDIKNTGCRKFIARMMLDILKIRKLKNHPARMENLLKALQNVLFQKSEFRQIEKAFNTLMEAMVPANRFTDVEVVALRKYLKKNFPECRDGLKSHLEDYFGLIAEEYADPDEHRLSFGKVAAIETVFKEVLRLEFFSLMRKQGVFEYWEIYCAVAEYYCDRGYEMVKEYVCDTDPAGKAIRGNTYLAFSARKADENIMIMVTNCGKNLAVQVNLA